MDQIGYLVMSTTAVLCVECAKEGDIIDVNPNTANGVCPLYRVNIGDYKQTCHNCHKVLVEGKTPFWCELFAEKG